MNELIGVWRQISLHWCLRRICDWKFLNVELTNEKPNIRFEHSNKTNFSSK